VFIETVKVCLPPYVNLRPALGIGLVIEGITVKWVNLLVRRIKDINKFS